MNFNTLLNKNLSETKLIFLLLAHETLIVCSIFCLFPITQQYFGSYYYIILLTLLITRIHFFAVTFVEKNKLILCKRVISLSSQMSSNQCCNETIIMEVEKSPGTACHDLLPLHFAARASPTFKNVG